MLSPETFWVQPQICPPGGTVAPRRVFTSRSEGAGTRLGVGQLPRCLISPPPFFSSGSVSASSSKFLLQLQTWDTVLLRSPFLSFFNTNDQQIIQTVLTGKVRSQ